METETTQAISFPWIAVIIWFPTLIIGLFTVWALVDGIRLQEMTLLYQSVIALVICAIVLSWPTKKILAYSQQQKLLISAKQSKSPTILTDSDKERLQNIEMVNPVLLTGWVKVVYNIPFFSTPQGKVIGDFIRGTLVYDAAKRRGVPAYVKVDEKMMQEIVTDENMVRSEKQTLQKRIMVYSIIVVITLLVVWILDR